VWAKADDLLLGGALVLLLLTLIPPLAEGSRWLRVGAFSFQPSEVGRVALVVYTAGSVVRRGDRLARYTEGVLPHLVVLGMFGLVLILQPDFEMFVVYAITVAFLLWVGGAPMRHLLLTLAGALPVATILLFAARYRLERFAAFLNPEAYRDTYGYQAYQSLVAIGAGGRVRPGDRGVAG